MDKQKKILLTSGPTRELIDPVRFVTNFSSGQTGITIRNHLEKMGFSVTHLRGDSGDQDSATQNIQTFTGFQDLEKKIKDNLQRNHYHAVIHLAAVSDYRPDEISTDTHTEKLPSDKKINSNDEEIKITFIKNPKLLPKIKLWSKNKSCNVIGFKLTSSANEAEINHAVKKLFKNKTVDFVVWNDLTEISNESHKYRIYDSNSILEKGSTKDHLIKDLVKIIGEVQNDNDS